jgi:hypothetical protein
LSRSCCGKSKAAGDSLVSIDKDWRMMKHRYARYVPVALVTLLGAWGAGAAETHVLSHGPLRVEIDTAADSHTAMFGPRFDRTAIVTSVTVDGVELLGPWGLCDEFGLYGNGVLGYETAAIGDAFVKIGVGTLLRDTSDNYHFSHAYPVQELFPMAVEADDLRLEVRQQADPALLHRYDYRKTYEVGDGNELIIRYELKNTGERAWSFEHYNHHWFRHVHAEIGPRYLLTTGFELPGAETKFLLQPGSLRMAATLRAGEAAYYGSELADFPEAENTFELSIDDAPIVRYEGSFQPARFAAYASEDGFCPEVFKRATLEPGETARWFATYRFTPPE